MFPIPLKHGSKALIMGHEGNRLVLNFTDRFSSFTSLEP